MRILHVIFYHFLLWSGFPLCYHYQMVISCIIKLFYFCISLFSICDRIFCIEN